MRLRGLRIELERTLTCGVGLGNRFFTTALILRAKYRAVCESRIRESVIRVQCNCAAIHVLCSVECYTSPLVEKLAPAEIVFVCTNALRWLFLDRSFFVRGKHELQRVHDIRRDFILDLEHIGHLAVVSLRPQIIARPNIDELGSNAKTVACLSYAAFENCSDVELFPDLTDVFRSLLERECR